LADALDDLATRVTQTAADLVQGDTTVSLVQFADEAADVDGCVDLHLLGDMAAVQNFAACLRTVADDYRNGLPAKVRQQIGIHTSYANALTQAATHVPADAVRPAIIFFTDVAHDGGVQAIKATPTRDALFGNRTSFALLPVGLAVDAAGQAALEEELQNFSL